MQKKLKGFYLLVTSILITLLQLPFSFAKTASGARNTPVPQTVANDNFQNNPTPSPMPSPLPVSAPTEEGSSMSSAVYDSLQPQLNGLSREAFEYAKIGFDKLVAQGKLRNDDIISIVDFTQPSSKKRLYIIDLENYRVLFNTWVAHGRNSGREMANAFSNQNESYMSSPGFYVTRETYNGGHGYSLKLDGLERGINDRAYERAIVIHGAEYVNPSFIAAQGFIGRSLGCPAVPVKLATPIINTIKNGTCMFVYSNKAGYLERSALLN